jgi:Na+-translocating ferredoxin:NAD+ oxidoreductase RnfG subunit
MSEPQEAAARKDRGRQAIIILILICLGSGAGVSIMFWLMKDEIAAKEKSVFVGALAGVLGEAEEYPAVGAYPSGTKEEDKVYVNATSAGVLYAAMGEAQGYQSVIKVLVSVEASAPKTAVGDDPVIHEVAVVDSRETPGIGEEIKTVEKDVSIWGKVAGAQETPKEPRFLAQFGAKRVRDLGPDDGKSMGRIVAVTGATMTSRAVTQAVRNAVKKIAARTAEVYGK